MHLTFNSVNEAFYGLVSGVADQGLQVEASQSRNGPVMRFVDSPVTITYRDPTARVLLSPGRDANPFFHLYEALWMLAGRNDLAPLKYYVSTFDQFSNDGQTLNGAYGYRWRHAEVSYDAWERDENDQPIQRVDQLAILIEHLRSKPESRRAVLQMWNVEDDLLRIDDEFAKCTANGCYNGQWTNGPGRALIDGPNCPVCKGTGKKLVRSASKDVCCNLSVCFSIRPATTPVPGSLRYTCQDQLDMTVFNRSNDMILGMLGANVVHFSMLQEYLACSIGVGIGRYSQVTNDLHIYQNNWKPERWLSQEEIDWANVYCSPCSRPIRLVADRERFDVEVSEFVERHSRDSLAGNYQEPFLRHVAQPMCIAFHHWKRRDYPEALSALLNVQALDWQTAGTLWIQRRKSRHETKNQEFKQAYAAGRDPYLERELRRQASGNDQG